MAGTPLPAPENAYYRSTPGALRDAAAALAEAGAALEAAARALRRVVAIEERQHPAADASPPLTGAGLRRVQLQVARSFVDGQQVHYRDLFALVERAGHRVGGRDPLATFLTALSRSPEFEQVGRRSGLYRLKEGM